MIIVGVDEAGRGPLVGSVVAAAVILDPDQLIEGLGDSKKITQKKRESLYEEITMRALGYFIAESTSNEIDEINILQATMLAMKRAVEGLNICFDKVLVDGNRLPKWPYTAEAIIKGDSKIQQISAASILAKVYRDKQMQVLDQRYPQYGFAQHKGYPTKLHLANIERYGVLTEHRKSYRSIQRLLLP